MDPTAPNPYQAPSATSPLATEDQADPGSATRGARLGAAMIDGLISLVVVLPLQITSGVYEGFPNIKPQPFSESASWTVGAVVLWVLIHGSFLMKSSQTIGKKLLGIQVVNITDGRPAPLNKLLFLRYLPMTLLPLIPMVGSFVSLANILFIFSCRQCIFKYS